MSDGYLKTYSPKKKSQLGFTTLQPQQMSSRFNQNPLQIKITLYFTDLKFLNS